MPKVQSNFHCTECGWTTLKWAGRCGECQAWGTIVEAGTSTGILHSVKAVRISEARLARPITEIESDSVAHWPSGIDEFDRVLGGGIVPGATILGQIDQVDPQLVIVDSVQTVSSSLTDGLAGGPSQVREVASTLIRVSKDRNLPVLLVGHVTKDGTIAGPRLLEHLVDVVLQFEGDRQTALRFVRSHKNRFGPTDEVGCFEMTGDGIAEVADPSGLFLSRSSVPGRAAVAVSGTCVAVAVDGRRALPVEVQALIVKTSAPIPRRVVNGVDASRVAMLLAVLERRAKMALSGSDVYVSTVGGIRVTEPGADLAIALAIASAFRDRPLSGTLAAVGEISLAGEIRPVSQAKRRAAEANRLGFSTVLDAHAGHLNEALRLAFAGSSTERVDIPEF